MTFKRGHISRITIGIICILPVLLLFFLSVVKNWVFPNLVPASISLDSWMGIFDNSSGMGESIVLTFLIAFSVASIATVAGFLSSKFIAYNRYRKWLILLAYLPFVMSPVILAVCLKFYFIKMGLAGKVIGVIIANLIIAFPYSVIFFIGFWNRQIANYEILVQNLGGNMKQAFFKVIIPLSKSMLMVCFFQCFLIVWFEYGLTSIIGYGKVQTLTVKVYQFLTEANLFYAALSCCLLVIPPVILLWINKRIIFREAK